MVSQYSLTERAPIFLEFQMKKQFVFLSFLLFAFQQSAEATLPRTPRLSCRSASKGCLSCELTASTSTQSLLRYPNSWSLIAGRQRFAQRNQARFSVCGIIRPLASVRLIISRGRSRSSFLINALKVKTRNLTGLKKLSFKPVRFLFSNNSA